MAIKTRAILNDFIQRNDETKPDVYIVNRDAVEYTAIPLLYISEDISVVQPLKGHNAKRDSWYDVYDDF